MNYIIYKYYVKHVTKTKHQMNKKMVNLSSFQILNHVLISENVQEIMNSPLSHSFTFVESITKRGTNHKKIFTIDINKCRRNTLLNNKHDYCVFNVMDEPKTLRSGHVSTGRASGCGGGRFLCRNHCDGPSFPRGRAAGFGGGRIICDAWSQTTGRVS
jgi:hypothetical protein